MGYNPFLVGTPEINPSDETVKNEGTFLN